MFRRKFRFHPEIDQNDKMVELDFDPCFLLYFLKKRKKERRRRRRRRKASWSRRRRKKRIFDF